MRCNEVQEIERQFMIYVAIFILYLLAAMKNVAMDNESLETIMTLM